MTEDSGTPRMKAQAIGVTDVGRVREHNEDSFLLMDRDSGKRLGAGETLDAEDLKSAVVMAVCDGMGGAAAGEVASRMSADRVAEVLGRADLASAGADQIASLLDQAIQQANSEILDLAKANPEMKGMGTTLTAAVAARGRLFVSQVGDSRAYLLRNGLLNQITKDQSLIGQLIEEGTLTEEEAEKYGARNIVLQAVGVEETLRVDTKHWPLLRGDVVLLCSDGLSGMVKDARIRAILTDHADDLRTAADRLILEANDNGGRDNVTAILARFDGDALRAPMETTAAEAGMEKAGAAFKSPPPPDVPNPMKKVAIWGLAAIAVMVALFVVFRPTAAEVTFPVRPQTAEIELRDAASDQVLRKLTVTDGNAVLDKVEPGRYRLVAMAKDHFVWNSEFEVKQSGSLPLDPLDLQPNAAKFTVRTTKTPGVSVSFHAKSPHKAYEDMNVKDSSLHDAGSSRDFGNVPPGTLTLTASRAGFRDHKVTMDLAPNGNVSIDVPALEEIRSDLAVKAPAGFSIEVRSHEGELLASGMAGEKPFMSPVRVGRVTVIATAAGFAEWRQTVELAEGSPASVTVDAKVLEVGVSFRGVQGEEVQVQVRTADGGWVPAAGGAASFFLDPAGKSPRAYRVPPGTYRAAYAVADRIVWREFVVQTGAKSIEFEIPR